MSYRRLKETTNKNKIVNIAVVGLLFLNALLCFRGEQTKLLECCAKLVSYLCFVLSVFNPLNCSVCPKPPPFIPKFNVNPQVPNVSVPQKTTGGRFQVSTNSHFPHIQEKKKSDFTPKINADFKSC